MAAAPADTKSEFLRVLQLSGLDSDSMTDDQRDALINIAENSGLDPGDAEDMVDDYLEEFDRKQIAEITKGKAKGLAPVAPKGNSAVKVAPKVASNVATKAAPKVEVVKEPSPSAVPRGPVLTPEQERKRYPNYTNSLGGQMLLVPSGEFIMGNPFPGAPPNETPQFRATITRFYMSRFPITNAHFEAFDPSHKSKRASAAGDRHPVVYVSSLDAVKFCQWLSMRERKKYRLPTEAEWERAKGTDGRRYPWGNFDKRGDLANFADKNTSFAWSDRQIDDGYPKVRRLVHFPVAPVRSDRGHGGKCLGMVWRLFRAIQIDLKDRSPRTDQWYETGLSRRKLEVAFCQFADNSAERKPGKLLLQRSWLQDRLRVRVSASPVKLKALQR